MSSATVIGSVTEVQDIRLPQGGAASREQTQRLSGTASAIPAETASETSTINTGVSTIIYQFDTRILNKFDSSVIDNDRFLQGIGVQGLSVDQKFALREFLRSKGGTYSILADAAMLSDTSLNLRPGERPLMGEQILSTTHAVFGYHAFTQGWSTDLSKANGFVDLLDSKAQASAFEVSYQQLYGISPSEYARQHYPLGNSTDGVGNQMMIDRMEGKGLKASVLPSGEGSSNSSVINAPNAPMNPVLSVDGVKAQPTPLEVPQRTVDQRLQKISDAMAVIQAKGADTADRLKDMTLSEVEKATLAKILADKNVSVGADTQLKVFSSLPTDSSPLVDQKCLQIYETASAIVAAKDGGFSGDEQLNIMRLLRQVTSPEQASAIRRFGKIINNGQELTDLVSTGFTDPTLKLEALSYLNGQGALHFETVPKAGFEGMILDGAHATFNAPRAAAEAAAELSRKRAIEDAAVRPVVAQYDAQVAALSEENRLLKEQNRIITEQQAAVLAQSKRDTEASSRTSTSRQPSATGAAGAPAQDLETRRALLASRGITHSITLTKDQLEMRSIALDRTATPDQRKEAMNAIYERRCSERGIGHGPVDSGRRIVIFEGIRDDIGVAYDTITQKDLEGMKLSDAELMKIRRGQNAVADLGVGGIGLNQNRNFVHLLDANVDVRAAKEMADMYMSNDITQAREDAIEKKFGLVDKNIPLEYRWRKNRISEIAGSMLLIDPHTEEVLRGMDSADRETWLKKVQHFKFSGNDDFERAIHRGSVNGYTERAEGVLQSYPIDRRNAA